MIETHIDPNNAWSDAKQQITPSQLDQITKDLRIRKKSSSKEEFQRKLNLFRKDLDVIDVALIDLLKDRMGISEGIGKLKYKENVAILQSARWADILEKMIAIGQKNGLKRAFVEQIFKTIHVESIHIQQNIK